MLQRKSFLFLNKILLGILAFVVANNANAAAFQLRVESAADLGQANAGGAALAQDASAEYFNPAGLARVDKTQFVISNIVGVSRFQFDGSQTSTGQRFGPIQASNYAATGHATSHGQGDAPNIYLCAPMSDRMVFGFALNSPYGTTNNYGETSLVRYQISETNLRGVNLSPGFGFKITDQWSIGAAFDALNFYIRQEQMIRTENVTTTDSKIINEGFSWNYGWHAGTLFQFTPATRLGFSYRSKIVEKLQGSSQFIPGQGRVLPQQVTQNNNLTATIPVPALTMLSLYHDVTPRWGIMSTIDYTQWDAFRSLVAQNVATPVGTTTVTTVYKFHNTWRYALGTHYRFTRKLLLRSGIAYDQGPSSNHAENLLTSVSDTIALSVGGHYQLRPRFGVDVGYSHVFFKNSDVNQVSSQAVTSTPSVTTTVGTINRCYDFFGLQMTMDFA